MKEKKEKKKLGSIIFLIFIIVGMSAGSLFFGFAPSSDKVKYNGLTFSADGQIWTAKINGRYAAFSFLPADVQNINSSPEIQALLQGRLEIDTTSDINGTFKESIALAQHQMGLTYEAYDIYLRQGFTANNPYKIPVITCRNSTSNVPVIYFREGNSTGIYAENSCIIAEASKSLDFKRMKDKIVYLTLGVLK